MKKTKLAALYIHDSQLQDTARRTMCVCKEVLQKKHRRILEEILIQPQNNLHEPNTYLRYFKQILPNPR